MVNTIVAYTGVLTKGLMSPYGPLKFQIRRGFTIIEMLVVLVVITVVATLVIYGLGQYNNTQPLFNAQKELVTAIRSLQNQVNNGSDGVSVKSLILPPIGSCTATSCSYTIVNSYLTANYLSTTVNLPTGVYFTGLSANPTAICFSHPSLTNFSPNQICVTDVNAKSGCTCTTAPCDSVKGYVCNGGVSPSLSAAASYTITLRQSSASKAVILEGVGMKINRIYAQ